MSKKDVLSMNPEERQQYARRIAAGGVTVSYAQRRKLVDDLFKDGDTEALKVYFEVSGVCSLSDARSDTITRLMEYLKQAEESESEELWCIMYDAFVKTSDNMRARWLVDFDSTGLRYGLKRLSRDTVNHSERYAKIVDDSLSDARRLKVILDFAPDFKCGAVELSEFLYTAMGRRAPAEGLRALIAAGADPQYKAGAAFIRAITQRDNDSLDVLLSHSPKLAAIADTVIARTRADDPANPLIARFAAAAGVSMNLAASPSQKNEQIVVEAEVISGDFTLRSVFNFSLGQVQQITTRKGIDRFDVKTTPLCDLPAAALNFARTLLVEKYGGDVEKVFAQAIARRHPVLAR